VHVKDGVVVVTGGASGIGAALSRRFAAEGARNVVVVDRDLAAAQAVAEDIGGVAECVDVADAAAVNGLVDRTLARDGEIDLFCSNAGITTGIGLEDPDDQWHRAFEINLMSHVYAARAVLPSMLERGTGWLLNTASAAGLLTSPGDAPYAVTKHGAVALAEWLAIRYGDDGVTVSCLCPQGVRTPMLRRTGRLGQVLLAPDAVDVSVVGDAVLAALGTGQFLVLPHPEVAGYLRTKADDPDGWLSSMNRLQQRLEG
jgi:NAD(P)-dependent dehydrogenase (short-subunit alcohol dehydrogenase family)